MTANGLLDELEWRGILAATTPGLPARLATGRPIAGYIGFDPSGASLHVGHLIPIFGLLRLQRFGGRPVAVLCLVVLILVAMLTGAAGTLFTVAAYNYYAAGLPDPTEALTDLQFEQQTIVYDRTGEVELARLGSLKREVVTFDQIPDEMLDATTAIEDQDFWINPGFDPVGIISAGLDTIAGNPRGASTRTPPGRSRSRKSRSRRRRRRRPKSSSHATRASSRSRRPPRSPSGAITSSS